MVVLMAQFFYLDALYKQETKICSLRISEKQKQIPSERNDQHQATKGIRATIRDEKVNRLIHISSLVNPRHKAQGSKPGNGTLGDWQWIPNQGHPADPEFITQFVKKQDGARPSA